MSWVKALDRKLLRDMARLRGQIATISLVLASGIMCFISLQGTYQSLEDTRERYYDRYRFAHVFAHVESAPMTLLPRIETLSGVAAAQDRLVETITVPLPDLPRPAYGQIVSLPSHGEPSTNAVRVTDGAVPTYGNDTEVLVLTSFARAHDLHVGSELPVVINGALRRLRISGTAESPEFVYAIRPGALVDDPKRYAVLWMEKSVIAAAFHLEGSFNDVAVRLQPGVAPEPVLAALDRLLEPYGTHGAIPRKQQLSNHVLNGELSQLAALSNMVPLVFLGVAAFLINMVLGRLVALQRPEIAALKALGYTEREITRHYLGLVAVVIVPGMAAGVLGGWWLGRLVLSLYQNIFRFPDLRFDLSAKLVAQGLLVSSIAGVLGALFAVRSAVRLPPAEAMRPPSPGPYRRGLSERLHLGPLLGPSLTMVVRELERRPARTALSVLGIAGAVALVIFGHFGTDSLDNYLESLFRREQRQDLVVSFSRPVDPRAAEQLAEIPGVRTAEGLRAVPVRVRFDHRVRESVLMGVPAGSTLRKVLARSGKVVEVPEEGVLMTAALGEILHLRRGERVNVELLEGDHRVVRPMVTDFIDDTVGLQLYASVGTVSALSGDLGAISQAMLQIDPVSRASVEAQLRRSPRVIDVSDIRADVQRLRDMNGAAMDVWTAVSIVMGACVIFGVVYNNARISLAVRSRELGSLRVLGLTRAEVSTILIAGLTIEVVLALPIGLLFGRLWAELFFTRAVDQETFRFQVYVEPRTYLMAALVALFSAAASSVWVRRNVDRLDLIGVLKTNE